MAIWCSGNTNGDSFRFQVACGDTRYQSIIGAPTATLRLVMVQLMDGKRISVRTNGQWQQRYPHGSAKTCHLERLALTPMR